MCCYLQNSHYTGLIARSSGLFYLPWEKQSFKQTTNKRISWKINEENQCVRSTHNTKSRMWALWGGGDRYTETEMDIVSLKGGEEIDSKK